MLSGTLWGHFVFMAEFGYDLKSILRPNGVPKGTPNHQKSGPGGLSEGTREKVLKMYATKDQIRDPGPFQTV